MRLRSGSLNATVLRSAADLLVPPSKLTIEPDLGRLPFFNPDVAENDLPEAVAKLRARIGTSDGLLIATPEYAPGPPGS